MEEKELNKIKKLVIDEILNHQDFNGGGRAYAFVDDVARDVRKVFEKFKDKNNDRRR